MSGVKIPILLFEVSKPVRTMNVNGMITYNYLFTKTMKGYFTPVHNMLLFKNTKLPELEIRQWNWINSNKSAHLKGVINCNSPVSGLLTFLLMRTMFNYNTSLEMFKSTKCVEFVPVKSLSSINNRIEFIFNTMKDIYPNTLKKKIILNNILPISKFNKFLEKGDLSKISLFDDVILIPYAGVPLFTGDSRVFEEALKDKDFNKHYSFITLDYFTKTFIYSHSFNSDYGGDQVIEVDYEKDGVVLTIHNLNETLPIIKKYKVKPLKEGMRTQTGPVATIFFPSDKMLIHETHYYYSKSLRYSSRIVLNWKFNFDYLYEGSESANPISTVKTYSHVLHNVKKVKFKES